MSLILCIESTSKNCSVGLARDGEILGIIEREEEGFTHAENLSVFIDDLLDSLNLRYGDLSAIAISEGPGSYTGLRIGAATAKGLCYALNIPLIAVNTLEMLAGVMKSLALECQFYIPMIDARRMEVYTSVYDHDLVILEPPHAKILDEDSFSTYLAKGRVCIAGSGAQKFDEMLDEGNHIFIENIQLSARYLIERANAKYQNDLFEDLAYFEPFYLKKFHATIPKDKLNVSQ